MDNRQQLTEISVRVNDLLSQYVAIHNDVFKTSIRRIIPLPFLFKAIDFQTHYRETEGILSQLQESKESISKILSQYGPAQKDYLELLSRYVDALSETVSRFRIVLGSLYAKSERLASYNWKQYKEELAQYESASQGYLSLGKKLNELYKTLK